MLKKTSTYLSILIFASSLFFIITGNVLAVGIGDWSKNLNETAGSGGAGYNTATTDPTSFIGSVIQVALSFVGVVFLILMIYGGYLWMTARGEEQVVTKAKDLIRAAVIGLIIIVMAYAISYFILSNVGGKMLKDETSLSDITGMGEGPGETLQYDDNNN